MQVLRTTWSKLGPGFLYAGAAIGVSHLVQSTKAGAQYGLSLIGIVLLANVLKYPFFEAGPRYAIATGESLIDGYKKIGKWAVVLFTLLTISTAFIIQAAVTIVTAALFGNLFSYEGSALLSSTIVLVVCVAILLLGSYSRLDSLVKWLVVLLTVASIIAFLKASATASDWDAKWPAWSMEGSFILFLFALVGWMPAPMDISAWHSLWTVEKKQHEKGQLTKKDALRDFHIGYWGTAFLALVFVGLGALVLYGSSDDNFLTLGGAAFSQKLIQLYTDTMGGWMYPIIAFAAFATMFSTTLTVLDGAPRVLAKLYEALFPSTNNPNNKIYKLAILIIASGALFLILIFGGNASFKTLIQIATTASFVTAPLIAFLNYRLLFGDHLSAEDQPGELNKWIARIGLFCLSGFALIYLFHLAGFIQF